LPYVGALARTKKSKDGGCAAWHVSRLYALKGGNTQEVWCFNPGENVWRERETIPSFGSTARRQKVKSGADIVGVGVAGAPWALAVLKGGKTLELWRYQAFSALDDGGSAHAPPSAERAFAATDSPRRAMVTRLDGPLARGPTAGRVFEATGRAVGDADHLRAGVYMVLTGSGSPARKFVVIR
jgi:hypothetical protein